ncbi:MAG TPA: SMC family ATPase, partial [Dermatophilaceae bacterium]|nr:SMC family ATPase [Dermatophilaceae bacterium]
GRDAALTGEEIAALLRGCEAGRAALDSGARSLTALRAAERTLAAETTARDEARGRAAATVEALADVAARRVAEVERVEQAAALAARAEALTHELADLVRRSGLTAELTSAEESLAAARPRVAEQLERTNDAHTRFNVLRARQLAAMAATLSTALVDGRPCPVCGSDAHPAPADPAERVDQGEVDAAEAHWAILRAELDSTREGVAALEQRCASLSLALGTRLTPAELDDAVTVARQALAVATEARTALPQLSLAVSGSDEALAALTAELAGLRELGERHDALAESARIEAAAAEQALADALAAHGQCPCAVTDAAATGAAATGAAATDAAATGTTDHAPAPALALLLARAVEQHTDVVACLDSLAVAQDLSDRTREAFELARARLRTRLDDQGFDTADEVAAAAMTAADLAAAAEQLAHRRARQLAVAAILEDPALGAVAAQVRPDVDALSAEREQAHRLAQEATLSRTALERAAQAVQSRRASLAALAVRLSSALDELRVVTGLADACTGVGTENTRRMPLSAYVLAGRLERVVELANERLARMGDGRYLLEHSDDLAARGAKSGLGLRVVDRWTGSTRDPASLSGGETFMASLALALGLADAVRAESGGVDLQTLFVDEGFGSLDDDSLDQVMDVLDGLRDGGRSVGIVSHVPELRQRIPAQVVVTKSETGSSVRLRGVQGAAEVA